MTHRAAEAPASNHPHLPASKVAGLQECATTPGLAEMETGRWATAPAGVRACGFEFSASRRGHYCLSEAVVRRLH